MQFYSDASERYNRKPLQYSLTLSLPAKRVLGLHAGKDLAR